MTATRRHPDEGALLGWLDHVDDRAVTDHVDSCERCAATIERLARAQDDQLSDDVGPLLRAALDPPTGLNERIEAGVRDRARSQRDLREIGRLFGLAGSTLRALSGERPRRGGDPT